jgi:hypothetical protein
MPPVQFIVEQTWLLMAHYLESNSGTYRAETQVKRDPNHAPILPPVVEGTRPFDLVVPEWQSSDVVSVARAKTVVPAPKKSVTAAKIPAKPTTHTDTHTHTNQSATQGGAHTPSSSSAPHTATSGLTPTTTTSSKDETPAPLPTMGTEEAIRTAFWRTAHWLIYQLWYNPAVYLSLTLIIVLVCIVLIFTTQWHLLVENHYKAVAGFQRFFPDDYRRLVAFYAWLRSSSQQLKQPARPARTQPARAT